MTWPGFKDELDYEAPSTTDPESRGRVLAKGHVTNEYVSRRGVELMLLAVIQRDSNGTITGAASGVGLPDDSLTIGPTKANMTNDWEAVLEEDRDERIHDGDPPTKGAPKQLVPGNPPGIETLGIAFAKLARDEDGKSNDNEWYVWFNPVTLQPAPVAPRAITPIAFTPVPSSGA